MLLPNSLWMLLPALVLPGLQFGQASQALRPSLARDLSNPNSWEETRFAYAPAVSVWGLTASSVELGFWNKRLWEVRLVFPLEAWPQVRAALDQEYGAAWRVDDSSSEKSGAWGKGDSGATVHQLSGVGTVVTLQDASQKAFHWQDLFQGILPWLLVAFLALFATNALLAGAVNAWCGQCHQFSMKHVAQELSLAKDQSPDLLHASMHQDRTYHFRCERCGATRQDRYSGFWDYLRSKR